MVLYREQKRRSPWLWVGLIGAFVALLALVVVVLNIVSKPSDQERLDNAVSLISEQLDVLTISHYTADVMELGATSPEYGAAVEDIKRVQEEWDKVSGLVDPVVASATSAQIDNLAELVNQLAPVAVVSDKAAELTSSLRALTLAN